MVQSLENYFGIRLVKRFCGALANSGTEIGIRLRVVTSSLVESLLARKPASQLVEKAPFYFQLRQRKAQGELEIFDGSPLAPGWLGINSRAQAMKPPGSLRTIALKLMLLMGGLCGRLNG